MELKLRPMLTLSLVTIRGSLGGARGFGLIVMAFLPTFVLAGVIFYGDVQGSQLVGAYVLLQHLFMLLLAIVALLLAVPLFREEIDRQSITYLLTRSIGKPSVVLSKYVGYAVVALVILLPPALISFGIAAGWGGAPSGYLNGVLAAVAGMTILGLLAYGALFLFLGMVTRHALLIGLMYAFVWEFLISGVGGVVPEMSIMHYLLSLEPLLATAGPFTSYSTNLSLVQAVGAPIGFSIAVLVLAILAFIVFSLNPSPE